MKTVISNLAYNPSDKHRYLYLQTFPRTPRTHFEKY